VTYPKRTLLKRRVFFRPISTYPFDSRIWRQGRSRSKNRGQQPR
jgi:hypothetical protein